MENLKGIAAFAAAFLAASPCCGSEGRSASATLASRLDVELGLRGADYWGGIPRHPAAVNPVGRVPDGTWLSLAGEWAFTNFHHGCGKRTTRFKTQEPWPLERKIMVPGCWEVQGLGGEGMGVPHLCQDNAPRMLRGTFRGEGYYRRRVDIPREWKGKRVWLKVGGVRSRGWFYVNDRGVAMVDAYAGAWKYDITEFVKAGESAKIVACVDNVVAHRNGQTSSSQRWGGFSRDLELEATPMAYVDDAWVRGDFDAKCAEAHVDVGGLGAGSRAKVRVTVEGEVAEAPAKAGENVLRLPLRDFRPWSPASPNLYWATVELVEDGAVTMSRRERFGVRKIEVRGTRFYLNDEPFFFRGFGDDGSYPITGVSPSSREYHLEHLMKARACGFNYVRLHTHCEMPEYFEAADEAGILVQPELSYYLDEPDDYFDYDPVRDAVERLVAFRRYPSYAISCAGNEGTLGPGAGRILYDLLKKLDPDRLVQDQDGGSPETPDNAADRSDFCAGPLNTWERGSFNPGRAFICHEYLNLCVKQDSRIESDHVGVWLPKETRARRAEWLARFGLSLEWGDRLQDAQHAMQRFWQKQGIEQARKDPYCGGYCYWTICDCNVYSEKIDAVTAQGLFNAFWGTKIGGNSPADFAVFNSRSCLLLDTEDRVRDLRGSPEPDRKHWWIPGNPDETNRVYSSGDRIPAEFMLAHYGKPLDGVRLAWSRAADDGRVLASGGESVGAVAAGSLGTLSKASVAVPALDRPVKASLCAEVRAADARVAANSWDFWLFPKAGRRSLSPQTVMCGPDAPEAEAARKAGKNLILVSNQSGKVNNRLGWWWIGTQVGMATVQHPVFGDFPRVGTLEPLYFRIVHTGAKMPVPGFAEESCVAVGEGSEGTYLYLAAKERPDGGREAFVAGLDVVSDLPESISLFNNIADWVESADKKSQGKKEAMK